MKMKKQFKVLAIALSLLLLVTACIGIGVSAEGEEKSLKVISQNVAYSEQMYLYYAVFFENVDTDGMVLNVYTANPDTSAAEPIATVSYHEEVVIDGANGETYTCRAFRTPGVALKNLATKFYVQAVAEDGTKSAVKSYSVVEYFNEMIYNADSDEKIEAYRKMLEAGDAAQYILDYYPNGNKNDIPSNYEYIIVNDGTANGAKKGVYLPGESVELDYIGTDGAKCYNLVDFDGKVIGSAALDGSFTVSESVVCVPNYSFRGSGKYVGNGDTLNYTGVTATQISESGKITASAGNATIDGTGNFDASVVDVDSNNAYKVKNGANSGEATHKIASDTLGTKYVFETDIMLESGSSSRSGKEIFQFIGTIDGSANWWGVGMPSIVLETVDGVTTYKIKAGDASVDIELGEWFNLRVEVDNSGTTGNPIRYYVNGELISTGTNSKATTAWRYVKIWSPGSAHGVLYLDNTFFSAVTAE